jgi:hypothetical protein
MPDQPKTDAIPAATTSPSAEPAPPVATTPPVAATSPAATAPPVASTALAWQPVRPSRAPLVISILALVLAGCAAAMGIWQAMLAKQSHVASERAFVHVNGPQAAIVPDPQDRSAAALLLTAVLTNSGNTPTKNLRFFMRCVTASAAVEEPWRLLFQDKIEKLPLTIGPHATANAQCTFSPAQLWQIGEGKLHGYVLGDITYHDRFDEKTLRRTQFAWRLSNVRLDSAARTVALTAVPQGQHNCADEDCPLAIMTH